MFGWLRRRLASSGQVPEEARQYMAAIQPHLDRPFVRQHFHQVTSLSIAVPGHAPVEFFALEFRSGRGSTLAWRDGEGNWGVGPWLPLPHPDAAVACLPSYFEGAQAHPSLDAVLERLAADVGD